MSTIIIIAILIFSVIIHEVSHGLAAYRLGDPTAKYAGRLTLNPLNHLDPIGSVLLPFLLYIISIKTGSGIIFGWAKPVPYNPRNLSDQKYGPGIVGAAGPLSNIVLALIAGVLMRAFIIYGIGQGTYILNVLAAIVMINILLTVFNLIPVPPLDGSKLLFTFLPLSEYTKATLEQYGFVFLLGLIFIFGGLLSLLFGFALEIFSSNIIGVGGATIKALAYFQTVI